MMRLCLFIMPETKRHKTNPIADKRRWQVWDIVDIYDADKQNMDGPDPYYLRIYVHGFPESLEWAKRRFLRPHEHDTLLEPEGWKLRIGRRAHCIIPPEPLRTELVNNRFINVDNAQMAGMFYRRKGNINSGEQPIEAAEPDRTI